MTPPTLADLTAAGRPDVLPGYVLSPPGLAEWGVAERLAGQAHVRRAARAARRLPPDLAERIVQRAVDACGDGDFGIGMPGLDAFMRSATAAPLIVWLSLRVKHPQLTPAEVRAMLTPDREEPAVRAALELFGYRPGQKKTPPPAPPVPPPEPGGSTGPSSSTSSAPAAG